MKYNQREYHRCLQLQPTLCVDDAFIPSNELCTSLPESIGVVFSEKTQLVSMLYHMNRYQTPEESDFLDAFLTTGRIQLKGLNQRDCAGSVEQLLNHDASYDFANIWINLYSAVRNGKHTSEELAFVFILLAHKDEELDTILALQTIAQKPSDIKDIEPPAFAEYEISFGTYNKDKISDILAQYFTKRSDVVAASNMRVINDLIQQIETKWPCDSVTLRNKTKNNTKSTYNYTGANREINTYLQYWYQRGELDMFIQKVRNRLKTLSSKDNVDVPKYDPFVKPDANNWTKTKFNIDVEKKICDHFNDEFVNLKELVNRTWNMDKDVAMEDENGVAMEVDESSAELWLKKIEQVLEPPQSQHLIQAGLFPRTVPSLLLPKIIDQNTNKDMKALIGTWAMAIAREQRESRIKLYSNRSELQAIKEREMANQPHSNWKPCEQPK